MSHEVNTLIDEFKREEAEGAFEECKDCHGEGVIIFDDFNGEHVQYEEKCPCKISEPADFSGASDVPGYSPDR